jgi:segregation and condensation protein A
MGTAQAPGTGAADLFERSSEADAPFLVDLDGFEGPLDLLLTLAREQKIDLARISVLALADQYLAYVEAVRARRIELAADYLLMAAWLAFLKSRLLLPDTPRHHEEPSAAELATALRDRLQRLELMRLAGERITTRPRLGRDVFARGAPEATGPVAASRWTADLVDLLKAYAGQRARHALARVTLRQRKVWSLREARAALERLVGAAPGVWFPLQDYLAPYASEPGMRPSVLASGFASSLELAREGALELRQPEPFGPLYARPRGPNEA